MSLARNIDFLSGPELIFFGGVRDMPTGPEIMRDPKRQNPTAPLGSRRQVREPRHREWNARRRAFVAPVPAKRIRIRQLNKPGQPKLNLNLNST